MESHRVWNSGRNDKSRWESKFPTEAVHSDREAAFKAGRKRVWMREKACKIVKTEDVHLNSDLLKYWTTAPARSIRLLTIDPASSDSPKADENVVMTIAVPEWMFTSCATTRLGNTMPDEAACVLLPTCERLRTVIESRR